MILLRPLNSINSVPAVKSRNPDEILFVHYNLDVGNSEQTGSYQDFEI